MENWKDLPTASLLLHCMCTRESNRVIFFKPQLERAHLLVNLNLTLSLLSFINTKYLSHSIVTSLVKMHCRRNGSNLFQITVDAHPDVHPKFLKFHFWYLLNKVRVNHVWTQSTQSNTMAETEILFWFLFCIKMPPHLKF